MKLADITQLIGELSCDAASKIQSSHVLQVWEDGEITSQKCGDLLWHRNLHCMEYGHREKRIPLSSFPHTYGKDHAYVFVDSMKAAQTIRNAIFSLED